MDISVNSYVDKEIYIKIALLGEENITPAYETVLYFEESEKVFKKEIADKAVNILPEDYALHNSYPNPFNPVTTISYQLPKSEFVNLSIYNTNGQLVETLINRQIQSGYHSIKWDGSNEVSGVYFYRLSAAGYSATGKCILLK